ncbi:transposase [Brevibacillus sp. AG162]|nr:transposase [Brevibacillus sp. AG162]
MAKKGQTFRVYTEEEKLEAVRLYESGVSSREVARRLGISEKRQVLDWVNKVRNGEALTASRSNQAWRKGRPLRRNQGSQLLNKCKPNIDYHGCSVLQKYPVRDITNGESPERQLFDVAKRKSI